MTLPDLQKALSRIKVFQDELDIQVEERQRMIEVLKLTPSANENFDLINCLEKISRVLKYFEDDFSEAVKSEGLTSKDYTSLLSQYEEAVAVYNGTITKLQNDNFVDISEYKFNINPDLPEFQISTPTVKSVRFKDNLVEDEEEEDSNLQNSRQQLMGFKPYRDDEDDEGNGSTLSDTSSFDVQTNKQLFAEHSQQLLEQDQSLDILHSSVRRQHQMGLGIQNEIDDHLILLNDLERGVEGAHSRLARAHHRLQSFRKLCRENGSLVTIIVLTIILITLLVVLN